MNRTQTSTRFAASLALALFSLAALATPAAADDFDRPGWFVGAGGGLAVDFLEKAISDATGGLVEITPGGSVNVRGGYRVLSWLAFEGMYEGHYGLTTEIAGIDAGSLTNHSLLFNTKFIVPTWRIQPYLGLGVGAQQHSIEDAVPGDPARWDFMFRAGFGIDTYITKHWVANLELAPAVSVRTYSRIPSRPTDNVTLTFSGGIQYRF